MKNFPQFLTRSWRPVVLVVSLAVIAYLLFFHNLGSLLPGYNAAEVQTYHSAASWQAIWQNPVNAPYKAVVRLVGWAGYHDLLVTRLVSAGLSVLVALAFFAVIRRWYGFRVAFLSTILMTTSAGFLHVARFGSAQIFQMASLFVIGTFLWYRHGGQPRRKLSGYTLIILFALLSYIPGMVWFELFSLLLVQGNARTRLRQLPPLRLASGIVLFSALITPLIWACVRHITTLWAIAGLPAHFNSLSHFGYNLGQAVLAIGLRGPGEAAHWLGHVPLLDVIELALAILGAYFYLRHERSRRTVFIGGMVVLCLVLIGLGGAVSYASLIPFLYLLVASGLNNLFGQWLTVFPRNPVARFVGIGLVCIMLFFSVLFQTRSYFIAWPHHAATRHVFSYQNPG